MDPEYDHVQYKKGSRDNWNLVAFRYHSEWADKHIGPFKSTELLVKRAEIKPGDKVLDVACGTGAVSKEVSKYLTSGLLVGIDLSRVTLSIAKSTVSFPNAQFIEMDAENIGFHARFDKALCQYALMFFPDTGRALKALRKVMKKGGKLAVAVHGVPAAVPYFSVIMEPVLRHIPDIRPKGAPNVHRFGNSEDLTQEISAAGFSGISIEKFLFQYNAGTFEEYWSDYLSSTAISIRSKIESNPAVLALIKSEAEKRANGFMRNGTINFPWEVLLASAYN